jgi:hypothetical protein
MTMSMRPIRRDGARHPRGDDFRTGAGIGIVDLESSLNAVLTVKYFSTAIEAFAIERIVDTGRLSAGSRTTTTTTRARDGNEAAPSSS